MTAWVGIGNRIGPTQEEPVLTVDQDSPDDQVAAATTPRPRFGSPRFARLVQSPAVRRVSPLRLATAIPLGILLLWGLYEAGSWGMGVVARFVAAQPEHQILFSQIDLVPSPPPYIRAGAAGILANIRLEAKYPETISVLDTDLDALRVAISRNPWIKSVSSVRSSYRHLTIQVEYRQPFAVVIPSRRVTEEEVIDLDLVNLPSDPGEFAWLERKPHHQVAGQAAHLVAIHAVGDGVADRNGLIWKPATTSPPHGDELLRQAVQLARFLAGQAGSKTPGGQPMPEFPEIYSHREPDEYGGLKDMGYFLRDSSGNWVHWQSAPGSEDPLELKAAEKWTQLGRYIDVHQGIDLKKDAEFILFRPDGAQTKRFKPRELPGRAKS